MTRMSPNAKGGMWHRKQYEEEIYYSWHDIGNTASLVGGGKLEYGAMTGFGNRTSTDLTTCHIQQVLHLVEGMEEFKRGGGT